MTAVLTKQDDAPTPRPVKQLKPRRHPLRTTVIAIVAYLLAIVFLLPYLVMIVSAARPNDELRDASYLPRHWQWSKIGLRYNIQVHIKTSSYIPRRRKYFLGDQIRNFP